VVVITYRAASWVAGRFDLLELQEALGTEKAG
jgi:hypothetical protein